MPLTTRPTRSEREYKARSPGGGGEHPQGRTRLGEMLLLVATAALLGCPENYPYPYGEGEEVCCNQPNAGDVMKTSEWCYHWLPPVTPEICQVARNNRCCRKYIDGYIFCEDSSQSNCPEDQNHIWCPVTTTTTTTALEPAAIAAIAATPIFLIAAAAGTAL